MTDQSLYKEVLMDHFKNPRNKGDLSDAQFVARGSNPRCGDDLEVGVTLDGNQLSKVAFRGRGCSVCLASASMMTEAVTGKDRDQAEQLFNQVNDWFDPEQSEQAEPESDTLKALNAVRHHPARRKCVLLAWQAMHDALNDSTANNR